MKIRALFIFGTRPEAIKMAPIIKYIQGNSKNIDVTVCVTAQHRNMLDQVLDFFQIRPDYDLGIMSPGQTLFDITSMMIKKLEHVIKLEKPDLVLVHGDTTTAFCGALASYYSQVPVAHVEAGLRSGDIYSPFPEEINRKLISTIAKTHFAPTKSAMVALINEGVPKSNIHLVGNSVIDALYLGLDLMDKNNDTSGIGQFADIDPEKKIILVTGHRRESFGDGFREICGALKTLAETHDDIVIIYPVHLNPNVLEVVHKTIGNTPAIKLVEPLAYPQMLEIMRRAHIVLTDSGGIQEEAPSLGKPVLVMRDVTERPEGIKAGTAVLVGANKEKIVEYTSMLLLNPKRYDDMAKANNPYGDGTTSRRISEIIQNIYSTK